MTGHDPEIEGNAPLVALRRAARANPPQWKWIGRREHILPESTGEAKAKS